MRRHTAAAFALCLACAATAAQPGRPPPDAIVDHGPYVIFFDPGSSRIDHRAARVLNNVVALLRQLEQQRPALFIAGHSDRAGSAAANLALSCRRAEAARGWLVAMGHPPARLVAIGYGEEQPLVPTADGVAEAHNRNVEFVFAASPDEPPQGRWTRCRPRSRAPALGQVSPDPLQPTRRA